MSSLLAPIVIGVPVGLTAYRFKDQSAYIRFPLGFASTLLSLSLVKKHGFASIKQTLCGHPPKQTMQWVTFNSLWALTMAKSIIGWYGGIEYYEKHNIKSYIDALINIIVPCQIYFRKTINKKNEDNQETTNTTKDISISLGYYNLLKELTKSLLGVTCSLSIVKLISKYNLLNNIEKHWFIHMETLGVVVSLMIGLYNIPCSIIGLTVNHKAVVKLPWDPFSMFSASPRDFWKNWSRSFGEQIRYFIWKPLGGMKRPILSTLAMFGYNSIVHMEQSERVYGWGDDKIDLHGMRIGWIKGFAAMGTVVAVQVSTEEKIAKQYKDTWWWKAAWFGIFHISMCYTLEFVRHNALKLDLKDMIKTINEM